MQKKFSYFLSDLNFECFKIWQLYVISKRWIVSALTYYYFLLKLYLFQNRHWHRFWIFKYRLKDSCKKNDFKIQMLEGNKLKNGIDISTNIDKRYNHFFIILNFWKLDSPIWQRPTRNINRNLSIANCIHPKHQGLSSIVKVSRYWPFVNRKLGSYI